MCIEGPNTAEAFLHLLLRQHDSMPMQSCRRCCDTDAASLLSYSLVAARALSAPYTALGKSFKLFSKACGCQHHALV